MVDETIKEILAAQTVESDVPSATEAFSDFIVEESEKGRKLAGVIAATEEDLSKGDGSTVNVPYFPTQSVEKPGTTSGSRDMTQTAYSTNETSVSISRYGKNIALGEESIFRCKYDLVENLLSAIARGYGNKKDQEVCDALQVEDSSSTINAGTTPLVAVSGSDYGTSKNAILDVQTAMENLRNNNIEPDTIVMSPEMEGAAIDALQNTNNNFSISLEDGRVSAILGCPVIVSSYVQSYTDADSGDGYCAVLDSSRVLAEANGKPAKYEEERDASMDVTEQVFNAYWGVGRIDNTTSSSNPEYAVIYK